MQNSIMKAIASLTIAIVASAVAVNGVANAAEETLAQKRSRSFLRMSDLEKLTVGPNDNFQGTASTDGKKIFYTQNRHMASHIQMVELTSLAARGRGIEIVGETFDTRDPMPSPDGLRLAFTSFERNARGQICVATIGDTKRDCLATSRLGAGQPQWLNADTIVYLENSEKTSVQNVVKFNIRARDKQILVTDNVLSFSVHPAGNAIIYAVTGGNGSKNSDGDAEGSAYPILRVKDLDGETRTSDIAFAIPGLSGFPRFDTTGEFVYFSQFFNDTNNDGVINGDDNAVPFRAPWRLISGGSSKGAIFPEQLISAEYNCTYPGPTGGKLLVTCNFEDTLDVYRMPQEGIVPSSFTEAQLLSAHAAARTIPERVLLLNTLRFRYASKYENADTLERLLASHVVAGEHDAAIYYAGELLKKRQDLIPQLKTLSLFLQTQQRSLREKSLVPSTELTEWVLDTRSRATEITANDFSDLLDVLFDVSLKHLDLGWKKWRTIDASKLGSPLSLYLWGQLGRQVAPASPNRADTSLAIDRQLATNPLLTEETQASFSLMYMRALAQRDVDAQTRLQKIPTLSAGLAAGSVLETFLRAEAAGLEMILNKNSKEDRNLIAKLAKILVSANDRYFLKRGLNVHLLTLFNSYDKEQAVDMIASRWVSETKMADAEYLYAREQYLLSRLDKAYAYQGKNRISFSGDVFYGAVRVTDDAEAHVGFVETRLREKRSAEVDKEYLDLIKQGFVLENAQLVSAWRILNNVSAEKDLLKEALSQLESVINAEGYSPSVAWFLMGVANHRVVMASRDKLAFDRDASERAHHAYMVAADLSRKNRRMLAAIYENLGHLHGITRSYGQSASFYELRLRLPFATVDSHVFTLWRAGRANFAANNAPRALENAEQALGLLKGTSLERFRWAFVERAAFFAFDASKWEQSIKYFQKFFAESKGVSRNNYLKSQTLLAIALQRAGRSAEAKVEAEKVLAQANVATSESELKALVPFHADRYKALALSILAEVDSVSNVEKAIKWREQRLSILESWEERLDSYSLNKSNWKSFVVRECNHLARLVSRSGSNGSNAAWESCVARVEKYYDVKSDAADPALFNTLQNTLVTLVNGASPASGALNEKMERMVPSVTKRIGEVCEGSVALTVRWMRLSLLWNAWQVKTGRITVAEEAVRRAAIVENANVRDLAERQPLVFVSLPGRAKLSSSSLLSKEKK